MSWVNDHLTRGTLEGFWTANIFFPERNTLAFSEHFIAQTVMVLPVSLVSGNPILGYNVAFLLTFVLTGLGTYLLARALTGSIVAAMVAAFVAAFNEYRLVYEVAHLHTLSIHWFPFALYALHRYFETDRRRYLAWRSRAAIVCSNLSSVYYMAYCAPFVVVFALAEARSHRPLAARCACGWSSGRPRRWCSCSALAVSAALHRRAAAPSASALARRGHSVLGPARALSRRAARHGGGGDAAVVGSWAALFDRPKRWAALTTLVLLVMAIWLSLGPVLKLGTEPLGWPSLYAPVPRVRAWLRRACASRRASRRCFFCFWPCWQRSA